MVSSTLLTASSPPFLPQIHTVFCILECLYCYSLFSLVCLPLSVFGSAKQPGVTVVPVVVPVRERERVDAFGGCRELVKAVGRERARRCGWEEIARRRGRGQRVLDASGGEKA